MAMMALQRMVELRIGKSTVMADWNGTQYEPFKTCLRYGKELKTLSIAKDLMLIARLQLWFQFLYQLVKLASPTIYTGLCLIH